MVIVGGQKGIIQSLSNEKRVENDDRLLNSRRTNADS